MNRLLPQVAVATPEYLIDADDSGVSVAPSDATPGWGVTDWGLSPDAAGGPNWSLEAIDAPSAWACTTGSPTVRAAVYDEGFHAHSDIPNATNTGGEDPADGAHGLSVASIIGARGDNGRGIPGVMWNADLRYFSVGAALPAGWRFVPESLANEHLARAVMDDARVINISRATTYLDSAKAVGFRRPRAETVCAPTRPAG